MSAPLFCFTAELNRVMKVLFELSKPWCNTTSYKGSAAKGCQDILCCWSRHNWSSWQDSCGRPKYQKEFEGNQLGKGGQRGSIYTFPGSSPSMHASFPTKQITRKTRHLAITCLAGWPMSISRTQLICAWCVKTWVMPRPHRGSGVVYTCPLEHVPMQAILVSVTIKDGAEASCADATAAATTILPQTAMPRCRHCCYYLPHHHHPPRTARTAAASSSSKYNDNCNCVLVVNNKDDKDNNGNLP